jgi:hypothetical protein
MRERAMSLSQIAGDAEASQVIKGESQDIKAELDPSYVNVKVKQQVRYFLVTFWMKTISSVTARRMDLLLTSGLRRLRR